jgi:hypothetical protein
MARVIEGETANACYATFAASTGVMSTSNSAASTVVPQLFPIDYSIRDRLIEMPHFVQGIFLWASSRDALRRTSLELLELKLILATIPDVRHARFAPELRKGLSADSKMPMDSGSIH